MKWLGDFWDMWDDNTRNSSCFPSSASWSRSFRLPPLHPLLSTNGRDGVHGSAASRLAAVLSAHAFFIHPPARRLMTSEFSPSSCRVSCSNIKYRTTVVRGSVQHSPWTAKRVDTALFFFHPISPVLRAVVHIKNRFNLSSPSSGTWNTSAAYEKETADVASNMQIRSSRNRQISSEREASESFEGMSYFPSSFLL